jgi:hypothetical protein
MTFLERKESSLLPLFVVGTALVQAVLLLVVIISFGKLDRIEGRKIPNLVELADGTTARVIPLADNERSPKAISAFTDRTMVALMSWNGVLQSSLDTGNLNPISKPQLDAGVQVGEQKVTTSSWAASFALSEDFRAAFLAELARLTPQEVFTGKTQSLLLVRDLSQPQKLGEGKWKLDLVANLVVFEDGRQQGRAIPFNKTVFVRAIDTPLLPPQATDLQVTAYKARRDGLEIYKIQDLDR